MNDSNFLPDDIFPLSYVEYRSTNEHLTYKNLFVQLSPDVKVRLQEVDPVQENKMVSCQPYLRNQHCIRESLQGGPKQLKLKSLLLHFALYIFTE